MIFKIFSEHQQAPMFRLIVLILIFLTHSIGCVHTVPRSELGRLHDGGEFVNQIEATTESGNSEILSEFDDSSILSQYQTEVNEVQNEDEGEKQPTRTSLYWQHLKIGVQKSIAPTLEYLHLMNRYHNWYKKYTVLKKVSGGNMKTAMQVMREEYAKANELLMAEDCPINEAERNYENMDFVYRALKVVINDLEKKLLKWEEKSLMEPSGQVYFISERLIEDENDEIDEESINRAMGMVKRTAVKTAKDVLKKEAIVLGKMIAVNAATFYLQGAAAKTAYDSLGYLASLVGMLSSGDISLASAYLRDLEFRAALSVVERLRPIPKLRCDFQSQDGKQKAE